MKFIHFIDKSKLDSVIKNGIKITDCYRGKGILIYPEIKIQFKTHSTDKELIESEKQANDLANDEKWETIGALGLRQYNKDVAGITVVLSDSFWPIKVFIDIHHEIAKEFGQLLDESKVDGVIYSTRDNLSEIVNRIESPRFVLEGSFIVKTENALIELMEIFHRAGGGIWGAHSFDCMVESNIDPELILGHKEYKNKNT